MRSLCLIAFVLMAATLSACGGDSKSTPPPGSPDRPLVGKATPDANVAGRFNEADPASKSAKQSGAAASKATSPADSEQPGYQKLVERQTHKPTNRFTPCNLVTKAQANAIVGSPLQDPLEAPQGPTCIYRTQDGKSLITVAVQSLKISKLKRQIRNPHAVDVSNRTSYCGTYGQPMLYVPISSGRVLSIAAPCAVAQKFAVTAVRRLND